MQGTAPFTEEESEEVGESGMKLDVGVIYKKIGVFNCACLPQAGSAKFN
jgi:hypothetical protein